MTKLPYDKAAIQDLRDDLDAAGFEYAARQNRDPETTQALHEARTALYNALRKNDEYREERRVYELC